MPPYVVIINDEPCAFNHCHNKAKVRLYNERNAFIGFYCLLHGPKERDRIAAEILARPR
jgi:hypothetical protein